MTAKEAAEKADKSNLDLNIKAMLKYLPEIEKSIDIVISKGEYVFYYYDSLPEIVQKYLESLGYSVKRQMSGYNETCYEIKF